MRTYVPSPESDSLRSDETDSDDDSEPVVEHDKTLKPPVVTDTRPSALGVFTRRIRLALAHTSEFWLMPVSVYDTIAACLFTLTVLLVAHFCIISSYYSTLVRDELI